MYEDHVLKGPVFLSIVTNMSISWFLPALPQKNIPTVIEIYTYIHLHTHAHGGESLPYICAKPTAIYVEKGFPII